LERYTEASLLPACGHSFCASGVREAKCPLCRSPFTPGSQVVVVASVMEAEAAVETVAVMMEVAESEAVVKGTPYPPFLPVRSSPLGVAVAHPRPRPR
jgi:hypothetical protein